MFGVKNVDIIRIPSENHAPHLANIVNRSSVSHFPKVFWEVMHSLARPHDGKVFLIAAGTFGKYYACVIKKHGGIALDMGSIVDGWMKLASRPFYASAFGIEDTNKSGEMSDSDK
jgi:hypothetical protein